MPPLPFDFLAQLASKYDLSPEQKEVFIEHFTSEKTGLKLAEQLNISHSALRTRMTQVYQKFRINGKGPNKIYKLRDFLDREYKKSNPFPENKVDVASLKQNIQQKKAKRSLDSIKTGFYALDHLMRGGLMPSTLVTIAGRPGLGKSSFLASIVNYTITENESSVVFFSFQNSYEQLINKLYEIDYPLYKDNPNYAGKDRQEIFENEFIPYYSNFLEIHDTPGINISEIENTCYKIAKKKDLSIVVIDDLECLTYNTLLNFDGSFLEVSHRIKNLAKVLNIPILVTCPLGRNVEKRTNKRPMCSDLGEYEGLETVSDVLIFLYRDDFYNPDSPDRAIGEAIVAKNRYGCPGTVKLGFSIEGGTFYNLASLL